MNNLPVFFISSSTLESWDWTNPWTKGIGGSETSHIELVERLRRRGFSTMSYAPVTWDDYREGPAKVSWTTYKNLPEIKPEGIYIWYRAPEKLDGEKPKGSKYYFVAQDVDYPDLWTEERLAKVDRYICLCHEHALYTLGRYPSLRGRVYTSSNGIRSEYIRNMPKLKDRDPDRMFFPSSPDRGLKLLLEQWWRIRECNSDASLYVAYGFNNMKVIADANPSDWRNEYQAHLESMLDQPGVHVLGRLPQDALYKEWFKTGIWAHPTDFPETSCITCMEAQACGAFPVTNDLWALKDNVGHGWMVQGVPQKSELVRHNWLRSLQLAFETLNVGFIEREHKEMQEWALDRFDWERIADQWQRWLEKDMEALNASVR